MASKSSSTPAPLTFDLEQPLVDKIEELRETLGLRSTSEVVRLAISKFNFEKFKSDAAEHRQISVRLPGDQRTLLKKAAKAKRASIGELLRVAIEGLAVAPAPKKAAAPAKKKARR
jgi:Arc/MetJ-type ribon-helix-helix transcriptional regulator